MPVNGSIDRLPMRLQNYHALSIALLLLSAAQASSASEAPSPSPATLPSANKVMAFVQASDCDLARLRPKLDATAKALVANRRTTRVVLDWPFDEARNVDVMGRPSPIIAAVEVTAPGAALPTLAGFVQRSIAATCPVDVYFVNERRLMVTRRTWQLGTPSPGSKTFNTQVRKAGLSLAEFNATWAGPHADLALGWRRASGATEGHYVQNLVLTQLGKTPPSIDGVGEGDAAGATTDRARELRMQTAAHAQTFADMSKSSAFVAREVILKD
jgi:hypothetical protein